MLWHAIAPSRRYTKASHDVVRHPRLGSDAKVLILYVQGLPEDGTDLALSEHARKLGIKGRAFQRAKEQLVMCGFVHERRVCGERGRWVTQQVFSNVPLTEADVFDVWGEACIGAAPSPSARFPTVGQPSPRAAGHQLPVDEEQKKNSPRPPTEAGRAEVELDLSDPDVVEAERVLLSLRRSRRDLHLGVEEARSLAAQAVEWLRRGMSGGDLRRVLSSDLPSGGVRSAVGFLRHRLVQMMPEAAVPAAAAAVPSAVPGGVADVPSGVQPPSSPPPAGPRYVAPLITCLGPGTEHAFRSMAGETECPDCQQAAAWARWAQRRAADRGIDLAEDAAAAVDAGRDPDGWRARLAAAASGATADTAGA